MNITKKLGRPRCFDEDAALRAAIHVFWQKGYDGASLKDLTQAMGINGPSLYAAFGDKHALFLKAIDRYAAEDGRAPLAAFEAAPDIAVAVRAFLETAPTGASDAQSVPRGCFLSSCVATSAGNLDGVEDRLLRAVADAEMRLAKRFRREVEAGRLRADFPARARARLLFDLRQGFVFRARAGVPCRPLAEDLDQRVAMVLV